MTGTVEIRDVVKRFGKVEAVRDVSFSLPEGETVALVGHNGAGKTTLMKLMLGLIRPTNGSITVLGDDPSAGQFEGRRRLGYLPENVSFNAALTGHETLAFYARLKREPAKSVAGLLDRVGLTHAADRRVGTYSKGMRQRLGLAQALLGEPRVLLLVPVEVVAGDDQLVVAAHGLSGARPDRAMHLVDSDIGLRALVS